VACHIHTKPDHFYTFGFVKQQSYATCCSTSFSGNCKYCVLFCLYTLIFNVFPSRLPHSTFVMTAQAVFFSTDPLLLQRRQITRILRNNTVQHKVYPIFLERMRGRFILITSSIIKNKFMTTDKLHYPSKKLSYTKKNLGTSKYYHLASKTQAITPL
jgi:hypothetical protein